MCGLKIWAIVTYNRKNGLSENQKKGGHFLIIGVTDVVI